MLQVWSSDLWTSTKGIIEGIKDRMDERKGHDILCANQTTDVSTRKRK